MIISASYRTDIPAFYGDRFIACLETAVIDAERAIGHMRDLASEFGSRVGVWRYDPVVATTMTPPDWHVDNFARLADRLVGTTDEVVVSFAQIYRKTARNMERAAGARDFAWIDPEAGEKRDLLAAFIDTAAAHGMTPRLCGQPELIGAGAGEARCIDARHLGDVAARPITALAKPHRKTCAYVASRDIGAYDTCPHGCVYCYAVESQDRAKERHRHHDPGAEFLFPPSARQLASGSAD